MRKFEELDKRIASEVEADTLKKWGGVKAIYDETLELHVRLGVDSKQADQQVRGTVVLPNGTGKMMKNLYFMMDQQPLMDILDYTICLLNF